MRRRTLLSLAALAAPSFGPGRPAAQSRSYSDGTLEPVDTELVLAVDISGSIGPEEMELQFRGYAEAFRDDAFARRVQDGALGAIACIVFTWHNPDEQEVLVPWTRIDGPAASTRFAAAIDAAPRQSGQSTSISGAVDFALGLFGRGGFEGTRRVLDISGDGINNAAMPGRSLPTVRDQAVDAGIVVNGVVILDRNPNPNRPARFPVDRFYRESVIGGPGAFLVVAEGFNAFGNAIRRKLIREIADARPGAPAEERFTA